MPTVRDRCPDCWKLWDEHEMTNSVMVKKYPDGFEALLCCPGCHAKRQTKLPKSEDTSHFVGQQGDYGGDLIQQMRSQGRRVMRKGEIFGG